MHEIQATDIKKFDNWTALIYSEPGKGKTTMVKTLKGRTVVFSTDGMYQVLAGEENVRILTMDSKKPHEELANFYKWLLKNLDGIDNIVIDNLTTFEKYWLNTAGKATKAGMPERRDYGIIARVSMDFVGSLKDLKKNVLVFAHERTVEVTRANGGTYTQFQPEVRNMNAIMGIIPLVGRLIIADNQENKQRERIIVLQPSQTTKAKDQLIGNLSHIGQLELIPTLQKGDK